LSKMMRRRIFFALVIAIFIAAFVFLKDNKENSDETVYKQKFIEFCQLNNDPYRFCDEMNFGGFMKEYYPDVVLKEAN